MDLPCLPLILERYINELRKFKPEARYPNVELRMFPQVWSSTALGFGGIGGQAFTSAYTVVVVDDVYNCCAVFYGEQLAYLIENPSQKFYDDVGNGNMAEVSMRGQYRRKEKST